MHPLTPGCPPHTWVPPSHLDTPSPESHLDTPFQRVQVAEAPLLEEGGVDVTADATRAVPASTHPWVQGFQGF